MKAWLLAGVLAVSALAATPTPAQADFQGPLGCKACICAFGKMHFHGPLYNYGPYYGYPPFEPYGPWSSDLRYQPNCNNGNCGKERGKLFERDNCKSCSWGQYSMSTLKNVFHRTHPCGNKAGCLGCN